MNSTATTTPNEPAAVWDAFLESTPLGQYQQSSKWARVKSGEGWRVQRVILETGDTIEGGAQILWRQTRFGRVGYASKGPVLSEESPAAIENLLGLIRQAARQLGLRALIVQPPDGSTITPADLERHGFLRVPIPGVISATAMVDLRDGRTAVESRMSRKPRQHARQAIKRGVTVAEGGRADLPLFFDLMVGSCQRQHTSPNPARVEGVEAVWDAFQPRVQVGFARVQTEAVAGLFLLGFGDRCTFWKKGWNSREADAHANCLLNIEALGWACDHGYRCVDFGALDRPVAESLLAGQPLSELDQQSRHVFNLRLGAQPTLLPPVQILVLNPVLRWVLKTCCRCRPLGRRLFRSVGGG